MSDVTDFLLIRPSSRRVRGGTVGHVSKQSWYYGCLHILFLRNFKFALIQYYVKLNVNYKYAYRKKHCSNIFRYIRCR